MSDQENQPPSPSKQTSSVPLKKETVRVTLKAADAPPAIPSATVPMAPPVRPPVPSGPPSPTGSAPRPPAPTIPLRQAGTAPMSPAPTIRLAPTGGALPAAGLPKATVQLQKPTIPIGAGAPPPTRQSFEEESDEEGNEGIVNILSGLGFAAAIVVFFFQVTTAKTWIDVEDNPKSGDWTQIVE